MQEAELGTSGECPLPRSAPCQEPAETGHTLGTSSAFPPCPRLPAVTGDAGPVSIQPAHLRDGRVSTCVQYVQPQHKSRKSP